MSWAKFRGWLLKIASGFTRWLGHQHSPWTHKKITLAQYEELRAMLLPGEVLMSRTDGELTNIFIPGFWSHGAVYVGHEQVVEVIGDGARVVPLLYWMMTKDYVRACMPLFGTTAEMEKAAEYCRNVARERLPYDYDFASGNKALYCFELTYTAYQHACGVDNPWELRISMGVPTVIGDDFDNAKDKWETYWDSRSYH